MFYLFVGHPSFSSYCAAPMKRSLLFFTSAIALGALSGFLISDFTKLSSPYAPAATATVSQPTAQAAPKAAVSVNATGGTAFNRLIAATTAVVSPSSSKALPVGSLVLNQPVLIVRGGARSYSTLPQGTAVSLVKNEGRFMSVRHDQNVLTIPRSAVGVGVVRSN